MADIELVIKIPKKIYESVMDGTYCGTLYQELKNGIPLPKGHGKIIDSKEVYKFARKKFPCMNSDDIMCRGAVATALKYTTAIIENDEVEE